ncbi:hypothetical protein ABD87_00180 [Lysinibacillus sphaericus]|uniref:hypothetical protein n=1 Tax=Lysinibacillus sphaericus TaxID=1421 RepID=UPI0018CE14EE|nr:hypothetical protein [Lysinibacillus sphaericus]MBG9728007.1 hypothetical protein [Lysinibacillus sphaericus]
MKFLIGIITFFGVLVVIAFMGDILLREFPTLEPLWQEGKQWTTTTYRSVQAQYGTEMVILFFFGIVGLIAATAKKA